MSFMSFMSWVKGFFFEKLVYKRTGSVSMKYEIVNALKTDQIIYFFYYRRKPSQNIGSAVTFAARSFRPKPFTSFTAQTLIQLTVAAPSSVRAITRGCPTSSGNESTEEERPPIWGFLVTIASNLSLLRFASDYFNSIFNLEIEQNQFKNIWVLLQISNMSVFIDCWKI